MYQVGRSRRAAEPRQTRLAEIADQPQITTAIAGSEADRLAPADRTHAAFEVGPTLATGNVPGPHRTAPGAVQNGARQTAHMIRRTVRAGVQIVT